MNRDGKSNYRFIQRNTIGYWLLFGISFCLSKIIFKSYIYFFIFLILILIIHEFLWFRNIPNIFKKDEGEVTNNFYRWGNIYSANLKDIKNLSGTDLTEGLYNNNWSLSNKEALLLKYNTYFDYLGLEPGMKLLDIGSGNCTWLNFCLKRGIDVTGITITEEQANFCKSKGIDNIIVGDVNNNILETINEKFDAITNIGAMEHFSSISSNVNKRNKQLKSYYDQVKRLIKKESKSGRYLNSIMTINHNYSERSSLKTYLYWWLIASNFGYGAYPSEKFCDEMYQSRNSKIIKKRDCTEDYRWIFIKNKDSMARCKYKFDTKFRVINFIMDLCSDPGWFSRSLYGPTNCWLWQFGTLENRPMPENKNTPIRCYIYVTKIN